MLTLPHLGRIESQDPYLGETLRSIMSAINLQGSLTGVDPTGSFPAPDAPNQIQVSSVAGGFDVAIVDNNPQRGENYFVDYSASPSFSNARTVPLGTTRNVYLPLGTNTFYFRAYSQFQGSEISPYAIYGGATPQSVTGGAAGTPALAPSQGTGAGSMTGGSPNPPVGGGFGPVSIGAQQPRNSPGGRANL